MPSHLPSDLLTPTEGMNYGLDGFPELSYGAGVFEDDILSLDTGAQAVPDGTVHFAGLGDLPVGHPHVPDLSWLEMAEQDLERLPNNPVDDGIPELEDAWGSHQPTGLHPVFAKDREAAAYEASLSQTSDEKGPSLLVGEVIRSARRRVAAGQPFLAVATLAAARLGEEAHLARKAMKELSSEVGLLGKVYLKASDYPRCVDGRWESTVKKSATTRYLVQKTACAGCMNNQNGRCSMMHKRLVAEVPWNEALQTYGSALTAVGKHVSPGDPKKALQAAFLSAAKGMPRIGDVRPSHVAPADRISVEAARQEVASAPLEKSVVEVQSRQAAARLNASRQQVARWVRDGLLERSAAEQMAFITDPKVLISSAVASIKGTRHEGPFSGLLVDTREPDVDRDAAIGEMQKVSPPVPVDIAARKEAKIRATVKAKIVQWQKGGLLMAADVSRLLSSEADPRDILKTAASLVTRPLMASEFSGVPTSEMKMSREAALEHLTAVEETVRATTAVIASEASRRAQASSREGRKEASVRAKVAKVAAAIDKGVRGTSLHRYVRRVLAKEDIVIAAPLLDPLLARVAGEEAPAPRVYDRPSFERNASYSNQDTGPSLGEVKRLLRWARQKMTEGAAGSELDELLSMRFGSSVRTASADSFSQIREAHEGLSGHLYVDVGAYISASGTSGCEDGGLKHRANAIPHVLGTSRCATCTRRSIREDGVARCQVYNKPIIASAEEAVRNPKDYQREMIRMADASDAERTASLFAPTYDPDEFNLSEGGELTDCIILSDTPAAEDIGEVLWGGMEI